IQPKLTYDTRKDILCGLEDWGNNRTRKVADHVLVFMLRGLKSGWKMPIFYSFCQKQIKTTQLIRCIKGMLNRLPNSIKVDSTDFLNSKFDNSGSSNAATIKELLLRTDMKRNFEKRTQQFRFYFNMLNTRFCNQDSLENNDCSESEDSFKKSEFLICIKQIICSINKLLKTRSHHRDILKMLLQHFKNWNINMNWYECIEHHVDIFNIIVRINAIKTIVCWSEKKNALIKIMIM
ncbi:hypothetical protein ALC57_14538, partial [Trachymyrmex cornetzi]